MPPSDPELARVMAAAWNAGKLERVIDLAAQAPPRLRDDEAVLAFCGMAQQASGHDADAIATFGRLTRLKPGVSAYWNNLGVACRHTGNLAGSERALLQAQSLAPGDPDVLYNLGLVYLEQHRWPDARSALLDAVRRSPQFIDARLQAARACYVCGDSKGQEAMLKGASRWPAQPAEQALTLAAMLSSQGGLNAALNVLAQALLPAAGSAAEALRARIAAQRVALYERSNRLAEAQRELERIPLGTLDSLPADEDQARIDGWRAHAALATRTGDYAAAAKLSRRALDLTRDAEGRASAAFALATACDRQGAHEDAWRALTQAHAAQLEIVRETAPELAAHDSRPLAMADRIVNDTEYAAWQPLEAPDARHSPVFVIGFPRSGTTLLEQMLDAHPDFRSMDERGYIHELIERLQGAGQRYPADLANLTQADADQLRAMYFHMVERVVPDLGQRRLVDKNPLNLLCLPMILRLFPEARIILCLRHPCDVLLSCYMQSFRSPAFMAMCASLERVARGYARAFDQCCGHLDVFAPQVLEWRYESVVAGFDAEVACLGRFLDVDDAAPMTRFAEHARDKRFIATPSYAQVTEPVHSRSLGHWEQYREHFEPVLSTLQPWIERFGYDT